MHVEIFRQNIRIIERYFASKPQEEGLLKRERKRAITFSFIHCFIHLPTDATLAKHTARTRERLTDIERRHRQIEREREAWGGLREREREMERLQAACVGAWGGVLRRLRKGGALHADATAAEQLRWTAPFSMLLGAGCASLTVDEVRLL